MPTLMQPADCQVALPLGELEAFCRRWKITRLELFGSAARGELTTESDLDFLYTCSNDAHWGLNFVDACEELEAMVGRPVDLVSRPAIERSANPYRKQAILASTKLIYER